MAKLEERILLHSLINNPDWCLFYHREEVKLLLPALAKSHILVTEIEKQLVKDLEALEKGRDGDGETKNQIKEA
jgi:hypothetical protein